MNKSKKAGKSAKSTKSVKTPAKAVAKSKSSKPTAKKSVKSVKSVKSAKTAIRAVKPSRRTASKASQISYKSADTIRKRSNFIKSLSPAKQEVANKFLTKNLTQTYSWFPTKKALVTSVYNEITSKGIYFKFLKVNKVSKKSTVKSK